MSRNKQYSPLRTLALKYAEQQIPRENYLKQRDALLDALEQGQPLPNVESGNKNSPKLGTILIAGSVAMALLGAAIIVIGLIK